MNETNAHRQARKEQNRFVLGLVILATAAACLVGCGGGEASDNSDTGPARVTISPINCAGNPIAMYGAAAGACK